MQVSIKVNQIVNKNQEDKEVQIQNLLCLGHWPSNFPGKYFAILKSETDYKCAVSTLFISFIAFFSQND